MRIAVQCNSHRHLSTGIHQWFWFFLLLAAHLHHLSHFCVVVWFIVVVVVLVVLLLVLVLPPLILLIAGCPPPAFLQRHPHHTNFQPPTFCRLLLRCQSRNFPCNINNRVCIHSLPTPIDFLHWHFFLSLAVQQLHLPLICITRKFDIPIRPNYPTVHPSFQSSLCRTRRWSYESF